MRTSRQKGQLVKIGSRWYVRYWERRNICGKLEQKRASHCLGPITTRGKHPPADIVDAAAEHMATVNGCRLPPEHITTVGDFVENVYLTWIKKLKRPSTAKGYRDIWEGHLKSLCADAWMKDVRTFHVQGWLNIIGEKGLSRNTLKHVKSVISAIFKLAKQQDYFLAENPAKDTAITPSAPAPEETYAYSLEEVNTIFAHVPEPAATAFAVGAYAGLRIGEIEGLRWEDFSDGQIQISRSIWNGHETEPKTRKSRAPVPVIRQLADRLELHRLRCGNPQSGPIFANSFGKPLNMNNLLARMILPALNRCEACHKPEKDHRQADHEYKRDSSLPAWHGWHAARRGLGSNLYRLGVSDMVIQRILRHANVSTTATYYIKTATDDVREAMAKLESSIMKGGLDTSWTPNRASNRPM